jgi:hypothetical protein
LTPLERSLMLDIWKAKRTLSDQPKGESNV